MLNKDRMEHSVHRMRGQLALQHANVAFYQVICSQTKKLLGNVLMFDKKHIPMIKYANEKK